MNCKIIDMTQMSAYVPGLSTYNLCQNVHPGRVRLQDEAASILQKRQPKTVLDGGPSDGSFSTFFLANALPNSKIVSVEYDPEAVSQHRKNFSGNSNVETVGPVRIQDFVSGMKCNGYSRFHSRGDAVYLGGMWTDIAPDKEGRIPTMRGIVTDFLNDDGIVLIDEEVIPDYDKRDDGQHVAALWNHHGRVQFEALLNYAHFRSLANGREDLDISLEDINVNELARIVRKNHNDLNEDEAALLARACLSLATEQELYAFASGALDYGDHKSTLIDFVDELQSSGFAKVLSQRMWPLNGDLIVVHNDALQGKLRAGEKLDSVDLWARVSSQVVRHIKDVKRSNHLGQDPSFLAASELLKGVGRQIYDRVGDPIENTAGLQELGIQMQPVPESTTFGVHLFQGHKQI